MGQHVTGQRRGCRLAVGPGDAHQARARLCNFACKDFGVTDDFRAAGQRLLDAPVRLRVGQRHTRRQHETVQRGKVDLVQVHHRQAKLTGALSGCRRIIPGQHLGPAAQQGIDSGIAAAAKAEHADPLALECVCRDSH
jgi:hypothetical protein